MTRSSVNKRQAFTLLEMILALSIGMLLMVGLYFALDMHLAGTNSGREQVDQAQVARNVLKKMTNDIKDSIAMLDAYPTPSGTGTAAPAAAATTETATVQFNMGVIGESDWMAIYVSKVPRSSKYMQNADGRTRDDPAEDSDLRRIVYWLVPNSDGSGGIARQEVKIVTSDEEIANMPPGIPDEQSMVFANQVIALSFEYFDGTTWQTSWDGTFKPTEEGPPVGPPVAIAINVTVVRAEHYDLGTDDPNARTFRHVVQIPTASFPNTSGGGGTP